MNWGCPDWRDASAYPSDLTAPEWRWEFLRRNREYREIFMRSEPAGSPTLEECDTAWPSEEDDRYLWTHFHAPLLNPRLHRDHVLVTNTAGGKLVDGRWVQPPESEWERLRVGDMAWLGATGLRGLVIPGERTLKNMLERWGGTDEKDFMVYRCIVDVITSQLYSDTELHGTIVLLDHTRPLKPQLEEAEQALKHRWPDPPHGQGELRKRLEKWPRHLRVIDARDQGASFEEIFGHLTDEAVGDDEDLMDQIYDKEYQAQKKAQSWHTKALRVVEKAPYLL